MGNSCPSGTISDAGLCYTPCKANYTGVGPVCWADCPPNTTNSGVTCTKDTSGRGVGTIPDACASGQDYDAGLCYQQCKSGFNPVGPVCWGICPNGFTDTGVDCLKPSSYGRGAGHTSQSGCQSSSDHGAQANGCSKYGLLWYPNCDANFHNVGCCVCSPNCPSGFTDVGISCQKPSYGRGAGTVPTDCSNGKEYDAGLCYPPCPQGYSGVGPVCWAQCSGDTTDAGTSCTKKTYTRGAGTVPDIFPWWIKWALLGGGIFFVLLVLGLIMAAL